MIMFNIISKIWIPQLKSLLHWFHAWYMFFEYVWVHYYVFIINEFYYTWYNVCVNTFASLMFIYLTIRVPFCVCVCLSGWVVLCVSVIVCVIVCICYYLCHLVCVIACMLFLVCVTQYVSLHVSLRMWHCLWLCVVTYHRQSVIACH